MPVGLFIGINLDKRGGPATIPLPFPSLALQNGGGGAEEGGGRGIEPSGLIVGKASYRRRHLY